MKTINCPSCGRAITRATEGSGDSCEACEARRRVPEFNWTGDLEDNCSCEWNGFRAVAEQMSKRDWHCSVGYAPKVGELNGAQLFCATEDNIRPLTGEAARRLCELVMEREWYKQSCQALVEANNLEILRGNLGL